MESPAGTSSTRLPPLGLVGLFLVTCVFYAWTASPYHGIKDWGTGREYYNLLADGLRQGRLVLGRVDHDRLADRRDHPLGRRGHHARIVAAAFEIVVEAHRLAPLARIGRGEQVPDVRPLLGSARRRGLGVAPCKCKTGVRAHGVSPARLGSDHAPRERDPERLMDNVRLF